jgi:hypothetical protein
MTETNKDILQNPELKQTPYSVPEGYIDKFKAQARTYTEPKYVPVNLRSRLAPYVGIAAMFLFILVLGKVFVKPTDAVPSDSAAAEISVIDEGYEDYLVFSDINTTDVLYMEEDGLEIEEISDEDIIEYLIYIGATEKYIESNNE